MLSEQLKWEGFGMITGTDILKNCLNGCIMIVCMIGDSILEEVKLI
jgi:hypothetical protein